LEVYFAVTGLPGGEEIWRSTRLSTSEPWASPTVVSELNQNTGTDSMPGVTSDGLALYYVHASDPDTRQLHVATRDTRDAEWNTPGPIEFSNYAGIGDSPSGTCDGLLLVWARGGSGSSRVFRAQRSSRNEPWDSLGEVEGLSETGGSAGEPWISDDGLTLFYRHEEGPSADTYRAARPNRDEFFAAPTREDTISSDAYDGDPWLSQDLRFVMFASERDGASMLFEAER